MGQSEPRIAIVCRGCGSGGSVAAVALRHAAELAKRDFRVTLLSDTFPPDVAQGVECITVVARQYDFLRRFAHVPNELAFVYGSRRALSPLQQRLDFIVAHSHAIAALAASRFPAIPHALVTHSDTADQPKGTYDPLVRRFYRTVESRAYRCAALILAISPYMASTAVRRGANAGDVVVVPNGIDLDEYAETPRDISDSDPLRLLYIGRLAVEKGVDLLLDACAILRRRGVPFHLHVVGGGPLESSLRARADGPISFEGHQGRGVVKQFLAGATLVCVTSRSEPQGLVVLEALASGVPVVATNVGGIPSMVRDGVNGLLVPPDSAAIAGAIERLGRDRALLRSMARAARPSVAAFSWDAVADRLAEVLRGRMRPIEWRQ